LRAEHPDIGRWGNGVVERQLLRSLQEETVFRAHDAKRRLTLLRKQFPGLENNVPHHLIASYLGITPVSFSRLRKQMARQ
jgi:CRP-like cAMP-binding protein